MNLKNTYMKKANYLMERLLDEVGPDDASAVPGPGVGATGGNDVTAGEEPTGEATEGDDVPTEEPEKGQAEQIEIFFANLDDKTQKVLMDAIKEAVNAAEDDNYSEEKIVDALKAKPIITIQAEELVRKLNIDV